MSRLRSSLCGFPARPALAVKNHPDWTGKAAAAGVAARAIQREETPADSFSTLVYLCSDDSNFVSGQTISVDGGALMR